MSLSPETIRAIQQLATDMGALFTPPELIVGCQVKSIADKDEYATDNGWIEAVVGRHNQQRCRWRGQFAGVAVNDYVDVLYFASYKLFVVFGQGGTGAIPQNILNKYDATTAPTVNDDSDDGYSVGSHWFNVTNDMAYVCLDATVGAAVWEPVVKQYELWESDGGAVAGQTDTVGDFTLNGTRDIFPQASTNGLNARFERLFGDDVPADDYYLTWRQFHIDDSVNHQLGFETPANPYTPSPAGSWSVYHPHVSQLFNTTQANHWLFIGNTTTAANHAYLEWAQATPYDDIKVICQPQQQVYSYDWLGSEIRMWDAATPGSPIATDDYWSIRFNWKPVSFPDHPYRVGVWRGTGITFAHGDGAVQGIEHPLPSGPIYLWIRFLASFMGVYAYATEGPASLFVQGTSYSTYPTDFNTVWFSVPYQNPCNAQLFIDQIKIEDNV